MYKACIDTNEITHAGLYLRQIETHALWREMRVLKSGSVNQVKPARVPDTPMKKFFYGLREE